MHANSYLTTLEFEGVTINIVPKKIKHSYLRVRDDGSVLMTVNQRLSSIQIHDILKTNLPKLKSRIIHLKEKFTHNHDALTHIDFLGEAIPVQICNSTQAGSVALVAGCEIHGNNILRIGVADLDDIVITKQQITLWYHKQARQIFNERFKLGLNKIDSWKVSVPKFQIRAMKSRWGSYSRATHKVCLSLWLIKFPLELIDYVIAHELTHIIHFNHSKEFYAQLATICPLWQQQRQQLRSLACQSQNKLL